MENAVDSPTPQATAPPTSEPPQRDKYPYREPRDLISPTQRAYFGLVMNVQAASSVSLVGYSDADHANYPDDYKSVSGNVTLRDGNVVSYASRKQLINARSTYEAEYITVNEYTRDLLSFKGLLDELHWKHDLPVLRGDNVGSIRLAIKPGKHRRTRSIS
ncbi:Integrase, catalytic core protein [Phytophthora megakarya]|uniref:Integrase, catalytic core protein n=1 Tax=Phytophthora megakarya TaxID=4795 RepID=A0A225VQZ5_9STRA|nr:Integrase, catalytic core protein [Phytophthora megakarya]